MNPQNNLPNTEPTPQADLASGKTIVSDAIQSAQNVLGMPTAPATPTVPETPAAQTSPTVPPSPTVPSAPINMATTSPAEAAISQSTPLPETAPSSPPQPLAPEPMHPQAFVGSDMDPSSASNGVVLTMPTLPKKKRRLLPIIIAGLVGLLILIGLPAAYFGYWTRSDVVYERFQKNIAEVIDQTGTTEFDLINNLTYKVDVKSDSEDLALNATSNGQAAESGFDSTSDITYKEATLNVGVRTLTEDTEPNTYYFKLKGIATMLKAVYGDEASSFAPPATISKYDDKWISINLNDFLSSKADEANKEKTLTKAQYQELWKLFAPIIKARLVGLDSDNDVYKISNPRSEKINGKATWAYDVTYDKKAVNDMLDEMKKAVEGSSLTAGQKELVNETIDGSKEYIPKEEIPTDSTYKSKYRDESTTTLWIDKNKGQPIRASTTSQSFYDDKPETKTVATVDITSITPEYIKGTSKFESNSEYMNSTMSAEFTIDNKIKTLNSQGSYETTYKDDGQKPNKITFTASVQPNTNKEPVTKPAGSIPIKDVMTDLYGPGY